MSTLIFLHGHDDDADTWKAVAEAMAPPDWDVVRPSGPAERAWFATDEHGMPRPGSVDVARAAVARHVLAAGEPVVLAGFSQGAATALLYALHPASPPVAAVVAIAGWLPEADGLHPEARVAGGFVLCHGAEDDVVPLTIGRSMARLLERREYDVLLVEADGGHDPTPFVPEIRRILGTI